METLHQTKSLFQPVRINGTNLRNAIVMAPMTRSRAIGNVANDLIAEYYRQRSSAGLIITEGTAPSPDGLGYARIPGIFSAEQIESWKPVTEAVHRDGGVIFLQLMHVGRIAHKANMMAGARILAPSAVRAGGQMWTDTLGLQPNDEPAEMSAADVENTIEAFVQAARNAVEAGFDGIELHGANGYLLEQFLNPNTNRRTDAYGGSIANRIRFVVETTKRVADAIGSHRTGVRISPYSTFNDMAAYDGTYETYLLLVQQLEEFKLAYLHVVDYAARATTEGMELLDAIRKHFTGALILNGGYTLERAQAALDANEADLISFGSPFIANPDLPRRLKEGLALSTADQKTFYTASAEGYTDYAFAYD